MGQAGGGRPAVGPARRRRDACAGAAGRCGGGAAPYRDAGPSRLLDLATPLSVFSLLQAELHLVWRDRQPVSTDVGLPVTPTASLAIMSG